MLLTAQKNNRFATIFAAAVILTASFDIFLAFDVAGFTVRAAQILAIGLYVPALWNAFKERKIALPHGWKPLLVCLAALFAATFHSQWYVKNIAYDIWLLSLVAIVWAFTQLFSDPDSAKRLFRIYLIVFDLMAVLGIVQFLLAFFRIGEFFLTQYLVYWSIPRVNGFMYEPSYYATYMIMGSLCESAERGKSPLVRCSYQSVFPSDFGRRDFELLSHGLRLYGFVGGLLWTDVVGGRVSCTKIVSGGNQKAALAG